MNPAAQLPDHWNDVYDVPFPFKVDYNAKRLAVASLNHAYYQGMILGARDNPFAEFLHWELSSFHVIYDICDVYMEHDEGLGLGNFSLDNAPLPHPWCLCNYYIDSSKSLEQIGDEIGRWLAGEENPRMEAAFGAWQSKQGTGVPSTADGTLKFVIRNPPQGGHLPQPEEEVVDAVRGIVDRMAEKFPIIRDKLETIIFGEEAGIAACDRNGRFIVLDSNIFQNMKSLKSAFDQLVAQGHTISASDPRFIVAHELGHLIEASIILKRANISSATMSSVNWSAYAKHRLELWKDYFLNMGFAEESTEQIYDIIKRELGVRALDDSSEMAAQAIAAYFYGDAPGEYTLKLVEYIEQEARR